MSRKNYTLVLLAVIFLLPGCGKKNDANKVKQNLPSVIVAPATENTYIISTTRIGEVQAEDSVDLVARVSGFLNADQYVEGSFVKKGTLLFTIDPAEYEAGVKMARGQLERAQADQKNAELEHDRQKMLFEKDAVAKKEYDTAVANKLEADATVLSAEAELQIAELNLNYTKIVAPFDGWVGFKTYSTGNMVGLQTEKLGTIERAGRAKVNFEISELDLLRIDEYVATGRKREDLKVELFDQTGKKIPLTGKLFAWDNRIKNTTGTLKLQAVFDDPERHLIPGLYVKVRLQLSEPGRDIMIRESAVSSDVAGDYVMIIKDATGNTGIVERRYLKTGGKFDGSIRVTEGLKTDDLIVVSGLQRVRQGAQCQFTIEGQNPNSATSGMGENLDKTAVPAMDNSLRDSEKISSANEMTPAPEPKTETNEVKAVE